MNCIECGEVALHWRHSTNIDRPCGCHTFKGQTAAFPSLLDRDRLAAALWVVAGDIAQQTSFMHGGPGDTSVRDAATLIADAYDAVPE